jgi:hypothetical protein
MKGALTLCAVLAISLAPSTQALDGPHPTRTVPTPSALAAAVRFARSRAGLVSFAVVDSRGRVHGRQANLVFSSASVVKAMLLVSYLRQASWRGLPLDAAAKRELTAMIALSDNDAATRTFLRVGGDGALYALAHIAGMRSFAVHGYWSSAQITARDEAILFSRLEELVPARWHRLARRLLSSIVSYQRWGIPRVATGWHVYFKGGWTSDERGELVHQVARLERGGTAFALAILTDGNPSQRYGRATIEGIAARLLRGAEP